MVKVCLRRRAPVLYAAARAVVYHMWHTEASRTKKVVVQKVPWQQDTQMHAAHAARPVLFCRRAKLRVLMHTVARLNDALHYFKASLIGKVARVGCARFATRTV